MAVFLHIGLNKTGSSSIQKFCDQNRTALREHGIEYPEEGVFDSAHYGLSRLLIGKPVAEHVSLPDGLEKTIRSAVRRKAHVVLSSEYFSVATAAEVQAVKEFFAPFDTEVKAIVYLRRHDQWIASLFNQALKTTTNYQPWLGDIREYFIHCLGSPHVELRYSRILERWAAAFGHESIVVRPFEAGQFRMGELVWDFLGLVRADAPQALREAGLKPVRVNESIPEPVLRTIAAVRAMNPDVETQQRVVAALLHAGGQAKAEKTLRPAPWDSRSFAFPPYLRKAVVRMFADDYRLIAKRYLASEDGILFKELP